MQISFDAFDVRLRQFQDSAHESSLARSRVPLAIYLQCKQSNGEFCVYFDMHLSRFDFVIDSQQADKPMRFLYQMVFTFETHMAAAVCTCSKLASDGCRTRKVWLGFFVGQVTQESRLQLLLTRVVVDSMLSFSTLILHRRLLTNPHSSVRPLPREQC